MPGPFPKPKECEGCSYQHIGGGFVKPDALLPTSLLAYGEAPGEDEEREGVGFVGRSGRLLRGALQRARILGSQVGFSNAILCRPPWNEYPGLAVARECRQRHSPPELNGHKGPVIAFGQHAAEALTGFRLAPLTVRGTLLPILGSRGWCVYAVHPSFILRSQSKLRGAELGKAMDELYPLLALDASRAQEALAPRVPRVELPGVEQLHAEWYRDKPTVVSVDIEGKDGVPQIVGLSWRVGHAFVLPWSPQLQEFLTMLFSPASKSIALFHNASYDIPELKLAGVPPPAAWIDTIVLAALIDPGLKLGLQAQVLTWVSGTIAWKELIHHKIGQDYEGDVEKGAKTETYRRLWREVLGRLGRRIPATGDEWYRFYNGLDTAWTFELFHQHRRELTRDGNRFDRYYMQVAMPLQSVLAEMNERGMPFDPVRAKFHETACLRLERMAKGIADTVGRDILVHRQLGAQQIVDEFVADKELEKAANGKGKYSKAPELTKARAVLRDANAKLAEGFNIESNKQRTGLLYEWFGLPIQRNEGGNPTADESALDRLHKRLTRRDETGKLDATIKPVRGTREEVARLLKALIAGKKWPYWRRNYLEPPTREGESGPWLITQYSQHRAETGRLSSGIDVSDPDKMKEEIQQVQNIPKKLRDVVRAEKGRVFVAGDWSAIQWALAMWFCAKVNRPVGYHLPLLERQQRGEADPHTMLASVAFGVAESQVMPFQRSRCKAYTFGYLFDGTPNGLADEAGHVRAVGMRVCAAHDRVFKTRPWKDTTIQEARLRKFVETPLGWKRWFWGLDPNPKEILATLIQGAEADLLKQTLVSIPRGQRREWDFRLMTTTHDSIMLDCPENDADRTKEFLKRRMEQPIAWLDGRSWLAKVKVGPTWRSVS